MNDAASKTSPAPGDRSRWSLVLRAAFWLALLTAFVVATLPNPLPAPSSDKIQHAVSFLCLALLGAAAYPRTALIKLALGLAAFGALIEIAQSLPAVNRNAEFLDWAADGGGIIAALAPLLAWRLLRRKD